MSFGEEGHHGGSRVAHFRMTKRQRAPGTLRGILPGTSVFFYSAPLPESSSHPQQQLLLENKPLTHNLLGDTEDSNPILTVQTLYGKSARVFSINLTVYRPKNWEFTEGRAMWTSLDLNIEHAFTLNVFTFKNIFSSFFGGTS